MIAPNCDQCTLNREPVSGHGHFNEPDIMIIGEAPGREEVEKGKPFVGRAGKLLRETLTSVGLNTEKIYYTNACLCRPEANKTPTSALIRACRERLLSEVEAVRPKIIVPVGGVAFEALLGRKEAITKVRGVYHHTLGYGVLPTLHPAGLLRFPDPYPDFFEDLERVRQILEGHPPVIDPPYTDYHIVEEQERFEALMRCISKKPMVSVDLETASLDFQNGHILSIAFSWKRGTSATVDWQQMIEGNPDNYGRLKDALEGTPCCFHNGQFDTLWLRSRGIEPKFAFDTMLAHYATDERQGTHGLKRLAVKHYWAPMYDVELKTDGDRKGALQLTLEGWADDERRRKVLLYNGADADYTYRLYEDLSGSMEADGVKQVHDELLIPAAIHFTELELDGLLVDIDYFEEIGVKWRGELEAVETELRAYEGAAELNLGSHKQVSEYIFKTLGLRHMEERLGGGISQDLLLQEIQAIEDPEAQEYWKTKSSMDTAKLKPDSTATYMLYWLAQQHPWPRLLVRHRILAKKIGTYHDGYRAIMRGDNRIGPRYRVHGTKTGRFSSTDPNIHAMPRLKEVKNIFRADPGYTLIAADYSQAEIRMMAHFAKDRGLIQALQDQDIHRAISRELFGLTEEALSAMEPEKQSFYRRAAKTIAFGLIYGRSSKGLAPQLGVSVPEAEAYMRKFFRMMPEVPKWIQQQKGLVTRNQEVSSLYGRKRRFPIILDRRHSAEVGRQAVNMPIQSSVSDMTLLANLRAIARMRESGIAAKPWPHIHDGFIIQVPENWVDPGVHMVIEEMQDVGFETEVPFAVEVGVGPKWGQIKTVWEG